MPPKPVYLDCNATTPLEPAVASLMRAIQENEYGNAGSRTHVYGTATKQIVGKARAQVAAVVDAGEDEVLFTSGATESNNLALLGLIPYAEKSNKRHIISTAIEHKAVLEPLEHMKSLGFDVTRVGCGRSGRVAADEILGAIRDDTLLVSVMHVNNETGIEQPIDEICEGMAGLDPFLHVDAAQGFGKIGVTLSSKRIDLLSVSAHKIYGPKGAGALIARRRGFKRAPLEPLMFGGGQERGMRPGTLPVALIAGFGLAAELAQKNREERTARNAQVRAVAVKTLSSLPCHQNGEVDFCVPHTLSIGFDGLNSEALIVALKDIVAISNGSACTSETYELSHVLEAMGLPENQAKQTVRISWCHMTPDVDWTRIAERIGELQHGRGKAS